MKRMFLCAAVVSLFASTGCCWRPAWCNQPQYAPAPTYYQPATYAAPTTTTVQQPCTCN